TSGAHRPRREERAHFPPPSTDSRRKAYGPGRSRRKAESGVSRSAATSAYTGTRLPPAEIRWNSSREGESGGRARPPLGMVGSAPASAARFFFSWGLGAAPATLAI